ncbi:MAG TPA: FHA domain-containing protein [Polyangia bacterium]|nr:FHA domain-containing protein [Polyangia bacterium]
MDGEGYAELARRLSREGFVLRFPGLFLAVRAEAPEVSKIGFETAVVDFRDDHLKEARDEWEIFRVAKAAGNPYPDRVSVGRARNCDVVMRDPSISKLHAHFRAREGGWDLVDLESQNGTRVNGAPLAAHQPHPVSVGDAIQFGIMSAELVDAGRLYDLFQFG